MDERDDQDWLAKANEFKQAKLEADEAAKKLELARESMLSIVVGDFQHGAGVQVAKQTRKGAIDWGAVEKQHLVGIDLESFRKASTDYFNIRVD